ncbi:MAG: hypothetical protein A4E39_01397 [Methanoregulaceae archaeon PtaB.Bin152]|nr:MAG: hypothetical protein A4E39_01397 [Methanoregulaceae archaeon PtaB.Bin152]
MNVSLSFPSFSLPLPFLKCEVKIAGGKSDTQATASFPLVNTVISLSRQYQSLCVPGCVVLFPDWARTPSSQILSLIS